MAESGESRESENGESDGEEGMRSWKHLSEWTGGVSPDTIESLRSVRDLELVYPLLHALVGRSPRDFLVRAAVIEDLVAADRASFRSQDLADVLYWLDEVPREAILRLLRSAGWLEHDPAVGTTLTDAGRWAYDVLSFLHKKLSAGEILPTLAGVEYALGIGVDPIRHLLSMKSRLIALMDEVEAARLSYSEVLLKRAAHRLDDVLALSAQVRAVLDRIPLDNVGARRVAREIHSLLSRLHTAAADLHAAVTEVGRQHLALTAGMTPEQIARALMKLPVQELASVGGAALLPVLPLVPLITTEVLASAAEQHILRERPEPEVFLWEEPQLARSEPDALTVPAEVLSFVADLSDLARGARSVPLAELVPRGDAGESFLRASLLPLAGDRAAGEGIAGRLGAISVDVSVDGTGLPEPVKDAPIHGLTPGSINPRKES